MVERKRHLAKALTYRLFGSGVTAGIAYFATGDAALGASIGAIDTVVKIGGYYLHERAWYRIQWGIRHEPRASVAAGFVGGQSGAAAAAEGERLEAVLRS